MATATKKTTTAKTTANKAETETPFGAQDIFKNVEEYTAAAREQFEALASTFTGGNEEFRAQTEELAAEVRERFENTQKRAADINASLAEAAQTETTEAVQFANDLIKAKSFADAMQIQQDYWTNFFEGRIERTKELTEATVEATRENMAPVKTNFTSFFDTSAYERFFRFPAKA